MPDPSWYIRKCTQNDLDGVKRLFDHHRTELGFVLRPSLSKSIVDGELLVAVDKEEVLGAVHHHHRRDGQTTLYHIAVDPKHRQQRIGANLIKALYTDCREHNSRSILLKCPSDLPANIFYQHTGFRCERTDTGKHRPLNIWILDVTNQYADD